MSKTIVHIEIIRNAGGINFPFNEGYTSATGDLHSFPAEAGPVTSGFYRIAKGVSRTAEYTYAESKYVINGEINIYVSSMKEDRRAPSTEATFALRNQDYATRITHTVVPGDFVYLPIGSKVDVRRFTSLGGAFSSPKLTELFCSSRPIPMVRPSTLSLAELETPFTLLCTAQSCSRLLSNIKKLFAKPFQELSYLAKRAVAHSGFSKAQKLTQKLKMRYLTACSSATDHVHRCRKCRA